jgi:hypothetical protein
MNLADQDLAVTPQEVTKTSPKGWAIVTSTSVDLSYKVKTNFLAFPLTSVLLCTWLLTRESTTFKPLGDAMFVIMLCLAPIVGVRVVRATDIRMKHVFLIGLAGIVSLTRSREEDLTKCVVCLGYHRRYRHYPLPHHVPIRSGCYSPADYRYRRRIHRLGIRPRCDQGTFRPVCAIPDWADFGNHVSPGK